MGMSASTQGGRFIVLEGIDGAGTTTQAQRLAAALRAGPAAREVHVTREPSDGPIGTFIRSILTGRVVNANGAAPPWEAMALLFAADRMDHVRAEIEPVLQRGGIVISDRYDASSLAYQSVSSGANSSAATLGWIRALNVHARRPDLTLVLSVPHEVAAKRRDARGLSEELYEKLELQRALAVFYADLPRRMPRDAIAVLNGDLPQDQVTEVLLERVRAVL
jgi:dTMP kinase